MQSNNTSYLARLDSLRFMAASMVLMFHATVPQIVTLDINNPLLIWVQEGHRGVNLFFALSGFLFALIAGREKRINYKHFIFNRFLRIFPLLIFVFLITAAIYRTEWHSEQFLGLFFLQFYLAEFQNVPTLGVTWTISIEFIFYLLFPFLHVFANKYGERYLLGLISLFMIMRVLSFPLTHDELSYFFSLLGRFDILLVGMLAGRYYLKRSTLFANYYALPLSLLLLTGYFLILADIPHRLPYLTLYPPIEALLWCSLVIATLNSKIAIPVLESVTAKLGSISYSMYLLHPFIILNCQKLMLVEHPLFNQLLVGACLMLPLTIALSFLSFYVIEKPFMAYRVRYFDDGK
ncbi:MAG: acyltransferase [Methylococcaceae bacterium]